MRSILLSTAAALLVGGCDVSVGGNGETKVDRQEPVQGAARAGEISIDAPGLDLKLAIPDAIRSEMSGESDIIYPGSKMDGLNVTASGDKGGQVQMRFTSADPPAKVAAWYRDPARAGTLSGVSVRQERTGFRISGSAKDGGDPFNLLLSPGPSGGTQAQLSLQDRN